MRTSVRALMLIFLLLVTALSGCTSSSKGNGSGAETPDGGVDGDGSGTGSGNGTDNEPPARPPLPDWSVAWEPAEPIDGETVTFRIKGDPVPEFMTVTWKVGQATQVKHEAKFVVKEGTVKVQVRVQGPQTDITHGPYNLTVLPKPVEEEPEDTTPPPPTPTPTPDIPPDFTYTSSRNAFQFDYHWDKTPQRVRWYFGDGTTTEAPSPLHYYRNVGTYEVLMIMFTATGTHEVRHTVTVNDVALRIHTHPTGNVVDFEYDWTFDGASVVWDFGDGTSSTDAAPSHAYDSPGPHVVTLQATAAGGSESTSKTVLLTNAPLVITADVQPDGVYFSYDWPWVADSHLWKFGDGNKSVQPEPIYQYLLGGSYFVTLQVTSGSVKQSVSLEIQVPNPPLLISADMVRNNVTFGFTWATVPDSLVWDFGDGTGSVASDPWHVFPFQLTYQVRLTVRYASVVQTEVLPVVIADVPLDVGVDIYRNIANFTVDWSVNPDAAAWDFGDGSVGTVLNASYHYDTLGDYTATVTVSKNTAQWGTVSQSASIDLTILDRILEILVDQTDNEVQFDYRWRTDTPTSLLWDFGDGITSTEPAPFHLYRFTGVFDVELTAVDAIGTEVASVVITVVNLINGVLCGDVMIVQTTETYGNDDGSIPSLAWAATKDGSRLVATWETAESVAAEVEVWTAGAWLKSTEPVAGTKHVFAEDFGPRPEICFRVVGGEPHLVDMRNAFNEYRTEPGGQDHYVLNLVAYAPEELDAGLLKDGFDAYAARLHDGSDGHVRAGMTLTVQGIPKYNQAASMAADTSACTPGDKLGTFGQSACRVFDIVFAVSTDPGNAGFANLGGIEQPDGMVMMDGSGFIRDGPSPAAVFEMGAVLTHELGHYALYMGDQYVLAVSPALVPSTTVYNCETSIMGASRAPTEFDDAANPCPDTPWEYANEDAPAFLSDPTCLTAFDPMDPGTIGTGCPGGSEPIGVPAVVTLTPVPVPFGSGPPSEPSWTSMIAKYVLIPDRTTPAAPSDGTDGGDYLYSPL